jgi:hypothetical protein
VPLLAINSTDDTLVRAVRIDADGNPNVVLARTRCGGHLGRFKAGGGRWVTRPVLEWLQLYDVHFAHLLLHHTFRARNTFFEQRNTFPALLFASFPKPSLPR